MDSPTPYPIAGVWRRIAAMVYDAFLLFAILSIATLIPALLSNPEQITHSPETNAVIHELQVPVQGNLYRLYLLAIIAVFYSWFWRKSGQTLGMQAWHIKLEDRHGDKPSWKQCLIRLATAPISLLPAGLGYWWIWIDKDNLAWHDRASHTCLRVLPKKSKK
ncbi:MAG: RDD family protein [Spongiibacteraceae bacterium]